MGMDEIRCSVFRGATESQRLRVPGVDAGGNGYEVVKLDAARADIPISLD